MILAPRKTSTDETATPTEGVETPLKKKPAKRLKAEEPAVEETLAEKPKRSRAKKAEATPVEETPAEKPKRTRAKKAVEEAPLEDAPAAEEAAPKPKRVRLKKVEAVLVTVDLEAERKKPASKAKPKKKSPAAAEGARALLDLVVKTLDDNKAEEILTIDLAGKSSIADFLVIANGRSNRQVTALADYVVKAVDEAKLGPSRIEGKSGGDWVLIDLNDVIVHLFRPEVREFYKLEKMWEADFRPDSE